MSNNVKEFDYEGYEKSLKEILEHTQKDYWTQYVDINRHQVFVARTYLWVSVAIIGVYAAVYKEGVDSPLIFSTYGLLLFILALGLAVISFGICLYSLPARSGYYRVANPSWGIYSKAAYDVLKTKTKNVYSSTLTSLIDNYDSGVVHNVRTNDRRAKLLRITSWVLIASFCLSIFSVVTFAIENIQHKNEDIVMNDENSNESSQSNTTPAAEPASSSVPDVPVPQGPIGVQGPNHQTHSVDNEPNSIIVTEGVEEK